MSERTSCVKAYNEDDNDGHETNPAEQASHVVSARRDDGNRYENVKLSGGSTLQTGPTYVSQTIYANTLSKEQQCHQSFKTSSYEAYKDRNPSRVKGTCGWVLRHPQFQDWRTGAQHCLLWVSADPGCGKSVLSKSLADGDLQAGGQETICYFFFKDNNEQDNLAVALCALLHQLFAQQSHLTRHAIPAWERDGVKLQNECRELWRILLSAIADRSAKPVICILDALDECRDDDRRQLIELLCDVQARPPLIDGIPSLKFVVTSRPYDNVQRWFEETMRLWPKIRLRGEDENETIREEINLVIKKRVDELASEFALSDMNRTELQEQLLQEQLLQMQHRTYLWLHLAIEEVRQIYANSLYPDEVTIPSVPSSVEDAYERLLQKITAQQKLAARQVLLIIVGARRPLTIAEMAAALGTARACREGNKSIKSPHEQHLRSQIRQWCGLFVFIQHSKLFLVHQTAKEFLITTSAIAVPTILWRATFLLADVEKEMARFCMVYLLDTAQNTAQRSTNSEIDGFRQYCAEFWALHAHGEDVFADRELLTKSLTLSDVCGKAFSWFKMMSKTSRPYFDVPVVLDQHVIAMNGHTTALQELYKQKQVVTDARDSTGRTALVVAAEAGHLGALRLLLKKGAEMNAQGGYYDTALQAASCGGHEQIVQMLLKAGAEVNARGGQYPNALQAASLRGHEQIVQILQAAGASVL